MAQAVVASPHLAQELGLEVSESPATSMATVPFVTGEFRVSGLGDPVGEWRPVSVAAQRIELLAKMLGLRYRKTVCFNLPLSCI